jgi:hypothetical protein
VQTTGEAAEDDEAGALALAPRRPVLVAKKCVYGVLHRWCLETQARRRSGEYRTIATAVIKSQLCSAAAAAPLLECVSEQQRAESPPHAPLPAPSNLEKYATTLNQQIA